MPILLIAIFIWLIVLTIRYNHLQQIVQSLQWRLNHRSEQESAEAKATAAPTAQPHPEAAPSIHPATQEAQQSLNAPAQTQLAASIQTQPAAQETQQNLSAPVYAQPVASIQAQPAVANETHATVADEESEPLWPRVRPLLVATGLWPDTRKGSLEAQLTTFIATRLGIILGIAALVFLAVYLGQYVSPWVRFIELLLVPTALCLAARALRSRVPAFARVVLSGAMAMFYFTSFAAHAIPGVRIIEQAWLGFALQMATLCAIGAFAARRNDQPLAVLTQSLGFVACAFALYHGLATYLLSGCFLLGIGGALLYASRRWRACLWLGMAGTYGFYALIVQDAQRLGAPANWVQWLYPLLAYLVFFISERLTAMRLQMPAERTSVAHHSTNAALALIAGFIAIHEFQPQSLQYFYLGATVVAAGCVWGFRQQPASDWLAHQFTLKASVLFSLFLLEVLDGNLRCIALLLQALALFEGMRRHPSKATLAAAIVAWLFSFGALLPVHFAAGRTLWQATTLWVWLYLLGSSCMLLLAGRALPRVVIAPSNTALQAVGGILLGILAIVTTFYQQYSGAEGIAAALIHALLLLAPVLGVLALSARRTAREANAPHLFLGASVAISIALLWGHCVAWYLLVCIPHTVIASQQYWIGGTVVLSLALVLGASLHPTRNVRIAQHLLLIITGYTFCNLAHSLLSSSALLLAMVLAGWLLALLCALPRYRHLAYVRLILFGLALLYLPNADALLAQTPPTAIAWSALALAFGWQLVQPYWNALDSGLKPSYAQVLRWVQALLLVSATLALVFLHPQALTRLLLLAAFAAACLCIQRQRQPQLWLMQAFMLLTVAQIVSAHMWLGATQTFATLYPIQIALSALSICVAQNLCRQLSKEGTAFIAPIQTIAGLVALLPLLAIPMVLLATRTWLSLWYALPAFALVITGLILHGRAYRLIGLVALLLPLGHLFAYDMRDTVHRIAAFGLLALVLLLTGYIYNRILEGGRRNEKTPTKDGGDDGALTAADNGGGNGTNKSRD